MSNRRMWRNDKGLPPQEDMSKWKAFLCEFVGTAILVYVSGLAVAATGGSRAFAVNAPANAFGHGIALFVVTFLFVSQSGAHFNPAVTLAVLIKNFFTRSKTGWFMLAYPIFQFAGALLGGLFVWGSIWIKGAPVFMGVPRRGFAAISNGQVFVTELLGSTALYVVILWSRLFVPDFKALTDRTRTPPWARLIFMTMFNALRALLIGFFVIALVFATAPISGGNFDPARWLGLAVYSPKFPREWWTYPVAPFVAGIIAPIICLGMMAAGRATSEANRWLSWTWNGNFLFRGRKGVFFP